MNTTPDDDDLLAPVPQPDPYDEETWTPGYTTVSQGRVAIVRDRLMRCSDNNLDMLLQRVDLLLEVLPQIPMTVEQRQNADALSRGFRSLFRVKKI